MPVPPVVRIRLTGVSSAQRRSSAAIWSASSGTIARSTEAAPSALSASSSASPLVSSRSPREPLSLTVSTAAAMRLFFIEHDAVAGA